MLIGGTYYQQEPLILKQEDIQEFNKAEDGDLNAIAFLYAKDPKIFLRKKKHQCHQDELNLLEIWILKENINALNKIFELDPDLIEMLNERGETFIHLAAKYGKTKVLVFLCNKVKQMDKAKLIKRKDFFGSTAMHLAVSSLNLYTIEVLHQQDISLITIIDFQKNTPMDLAVLIGKEDALTKLYYLILNIYGSKNSFFEKAYGLAKEQNREKIIALFDFLNSQQKPQQKKSCFWKHGKV